MGPHGLHLTGPQKMTTNVSVTVPGYALHTHKASISARQSVRASLGEVRDLRSLQVCRQRILWRCLAAMPLSLQLGCPWLPSQAIPSAPEREEALWGGGPALMPKGTAKSWAVPQSGLETTWQMELTLILGVLLRAEPLADFQHFSCCYRMSISKPWFLEFKNIHISLFLSCWHSVSFRTVNAPSLQPPLDLSCAVSCNDLSMEREHMLHKNGSAVCERSWTDHIL